MPRQKSTHVDDPRAVGERLRTARLKAGLSQRQLSFTGCSPAYISRIEAGDRIPSLQLLREMGRRLGVTEDFLATGTERPGARNHELLVEAEVALRLDETENAERLYSEVLGTESPDDRAYALAGLGQVWFGRDDPRRAITYFEQTLALSGGNSGEHAAAADSLGRAYAMVGDLAKSIDVFDRFLGNARERRDPIEMLRFGVLLANAHIDSGNFERAAELLKEGVAQAERSRDPLLRARLYWSQSRLYAEQDDSRTAARFARKALELVELTEHDAYTARAHQLLAHIELDRRRPEEALELLKKGWPLLAESGTEVERAQFRLEEARALAQLDRGEEAAALAMEISGLLAGVHTEDAGRSYGLLADVYEQLGDRPRALELYELAAELLEVNPNRYLVKVLARRAELLEADGRKDEAIEILKRAVSARERAS